MIDITNGNTRPAAIIDSILRAAANNVAGVSSGPYGTILHLTDSATAQEQSDAAAIFTNWDGLTVNADKTTMGEGDADPVITVSSGIGETEELGYIVLLDGEDYDSGDVTAVDSTATLNLVGPLALFSICSYLD